MLNRNLRMVMLKGSITATCPMIEVTVHALINKLLCTMMMMTMMMMVMTMMMVMMVHWPVDVVMMMMMMMMMMMVMHWSMHVVMMVMMIIHLIVIGVTMKIDGLTMESMMMTISCKWMALKWNCTRRKTSVKVRVVSI